MVDNVCLHSARVEALKREERHKANVANEEVNEEEIEDRIANLSLNAVH